MGLIQVHHTCLIRKIRAQLGEPLFATPCCNTSRATWLTPPESSHKKPFFEVLSFSALFGPGCCCQLVCFEFGVLHFRLPLHTRNGQVGEQVHLFWFLALVLAVCCCKLVCFEFVVLHFRLPSLYPKRAYCRTRTYREELKKTLPRRPGHVAPRGGFSCRCANRSDSQRNLFPAVHTEAFPLHYSVGRLLLRVSWTKASKHQ